MRSKDMLDIWPALPLIIYDTLGIFVDNVVAALEYRDRVCQIHLGISESWQWEEYLAALQQPFPELTYLRLKWNDDAVAVPDSFLGGFAPRLEVVDLEGIPFPRLPKLLLSASHLVELRLRKIPHSGYFSPDVMAAALSTLTSLEILFLKFQSPESCPDLETERPPPSIRSVLPVLKYFDFKGASEYLEDLVIDIEAPQLNKLMITFFNDVVFDTPHLIHFIGRTPISNAVGKAHILPVDQAACVTFRSLIDGNMGLKVIILCEGLNWQLSSVEQICTLCLPFLSMLEDLYIYERGYSLQDWKDNIENRLWRELLRRFTKVKNIYISYNVALCIGPALQELVNRRATEALPTLENIFLAGLEPSGHVQEGIGQFVAARQVSRRPVTVSYWKITDLDMI